METNEIMNNEEVMDTTEEIVKTASKGGFSKVATIGVAMIAGGLAYKFVVAPAVSKLKEMKARKGSRMRTQLKMKTLKQLMRMILKIKELLF